MNQRCSRPHTLRPRRPGWIISLIRAPGPRLEPQPFPRPTLSCVLPALTHGPAALCWSKWQSRFAWLLSQLFLTLPSCWKPETVSAPRESSARGLSQRAIERGSDRALPAACAANLAGCSSGRGELLNPSQGNPTGSNSCNLKLSPLWLETESVFPARALDLLPRAGGAPRCTEFCEDPWST